MAVRYLVRRMNPENLAELKNELGDLLTQLGPADTNLRRSIRQHHAPERTVLYTFMTRKTEAGWVWVCPSVELSAENEAGLLEMSAKFQIDHLPHLGES